MTPEIDHTRTEYGVVADRTSHGLGYLLVKVTSHLDEAQELAARDSLYPLEIKVRRIYVTAWQPLSSPGSTNTEAGS